jgi:hypothetical protein
MSLLVSGACTSGPVAPSCSRRNGSLTDTRGTVAATATVSYEVVSPVNSNLFITVTWNNPEAELGLRATIVACGAHVGCQIDSTLTASQMQSTVRQLQVDGTRGKRYRIEVLGDPHQEQVFTIQVTYDTGVCT